MDDLIIKMNVPLFNGLAHLVTGLISLIKVATNVSMPGLSPVDFRRENRAIERSGIASITEIKRI